MESSNRIITDLNDSNNSKKSNKNNNKNIVNNYNTEPIIEEIPKENYNIISIKKKEKKNTEVTRKNPNKSSRQEQMLHLLALFIKGKTGLINCCKTNLSNANELLLLKGLSPNSLDNLRINTVNSNLKKQRKIFKNQKLPDVNSQCFIDDLFPPNKDSILGLKKGVPVEKSQERLNKFRKEFVFDIDNIIWLRAEEIFNYQHYSIFVNDISIDDVRQGYLGNCYFMSSLAAMTNMPQLICQLFRSFQINKNGCY